MSSQTKIPEISYSDFLVNQNLLEKSDSNYVDFWLKHINYARSGVYVGGVYISPWLYWHLNFFKIPRDIKNEWGEVERVIAPPKLRDNEFYIDWGHQQAKEQNQPLMIFGSRRIAKSTVLTSFTTRTNFLKKNSDTIIVAASTDDITHITDYFNKFYENRPDCFSDLKKFGIWTKEGGNVEIAFSKREVTKKDSVTGKKGKINPITHEIFDVKDDSKYIFSSVSIKNLEFGKKLSKKELLAGSTPSEVVLDECGKLPYRESFLAIKPAILTDEGEYRTTPLLSGTGGEPQLSENAEEDFLNADKKGLAVANPEEYKKVVKPEHFQFEQKSEAKTSLFVPAQMSNAGGKKKTIPLSEYLNRDFTEQQLKDLEGFEIAVTEWENATDNVKKTIEEEASHSKDDGKKIQMYYPFQPEDCFLHMGNNPLPSEEASQTERGIIDKGLGGEFVDLEEDAKGNVVTSPSKKDIIRDFPFKGGSHDAPAVIYERPIKDSPALIQYGTYVAGFDGYKIHETQNTSSVGVLYIFKRNVGLSGYRNQIVASLATRPSKDTKFYRQVYLLLKMYNAELLPERDTNLYNYLDRIKQTSFLANCKGLAEGITPNTTASTLYGLPPTTQNLSHIYNLIQAYCNEEVLVGYQEDGETPINNLGVTKIPDPMLLREIQKYGSASNFDRLDAFGYALAWDAELTKRNIVGGEADKENEIRPDSLIKKEKERRRKRIGF